MRILIAHNRYQQRGGEDVVAAAESELLAEHGHTVFQLEVDNEHIRTCLTRATASLSSIYSFQSRRLMRKKLQEVCPDIIHIHNFFPTLSPSVFDECFSAGIPVVHTLHNYRIICAAATFFRDGSICEECLSTRSMLPGIRHACYRSSHIGSAIAGVGMAFHEYMGTWASKITAYIALNGFAAQKLGGGRIPREKIFVKPNFAPDRGLGTGDGDFALFVGRLTPEKGIHTLIEADRAGLLCMNVLIIGVGPMLKEVQRAAERPGSKLVSVGFIASSKTIEYMRKACVLIMPSIWYEGGPLVFMEAFSVGLSVITTNLGNNPRVVQPHVTGLLYEPGDFRALASALRWYAENPDAVQRMRMNARAHYLATYTPEKNYHRLMEIYAFARQGISGSIQDIACAGSSALV